MTLQGAITLIVIFVLLGAAIGLICSSDKGWHGGCTGNCAGCHAHCSDSQKRKQTH